MSKGITRRDWLKLIGGSAAGLMLTPIPWKIFDETAKWSQNWSWTPVPRNGRINFKYTTCSLCPKSCGVRARCVEDQPVSLTGVSGHLISSGGLCAIGLGGHLLPFHPSRLIQPHKIVKGNNELRKIPIPYEEAVSEITRAIQSSQDGSVAILDGQPKRSISYVYRKFLAGLTNGVYITPPAVAGISAENASKVFDETGTSFGFDVENSRTVFSFGASVLDGWGTLGQFSHIVKNRNSKNGVKVIQVEPIHSRTAQLANEWIPVKPGTESALALAIANVLIREQLCNLRILKTKSADFENGSGRSFVDLTEKFSPKNVSEQTGISEDKIIELARELVSRRPSLVVFDSSNFSPTEQIIFADLNILLGAVGSEGGLVRRNELPAPLDDKFIDEIPLPEVPDHSVKVLILDGAESGTIFSWRMLQQKLAPNNSTVVSLSPYFSGIARNADYLVPTPTYLESYSDSPTPASASAASYSISTPILKAPTAVAEPLNFIKRVAITSKSYEEIQSLTMMGLLKNRVEKILKQRKGVVFDASTAKTTKLAEISSAEALMKTLSNGGCWLDAPDSTKISQLRRVSFFGGNERGFEQFSEIANRDLKGSGLILLPYAAITGTSHQLMGKLYKESDLREPANEALINPETARKLRLVDGGPANVKTENGTSKVRTRFDPAIMPDTIQVAVGSVAADYAEKSEENILEICPVNDNSNVGMAQGAHKTENDSTWRITKAEILPA